VVLQTLFSWVWHSGSFWDWAVDVDAVSAVPKSETFLQHVAFLIPYNGAGEA
jgi:hypothetical protein